MHVLVAGGTGFIGRALCRAFDERDHDVTAMSRSADASSLPEEVDAVAGDVTDPDTLEGRFDDVDVVVNLVDLSPLWKTPRSTSYDEVHRQGTEHLIEAATDADVDRFLQMSALDADPEAPTAQLRAKGVAEQAVTASDLDWTIIRPSVVFGDGDEIVPFSRWLSFPPMLDVLAWPYLTGLPSGGSTRFQPIWREDLVAMLAESVEDERHVGQVYELGGPEVLTLAEIVRLIHRAEGKPARLFPIPMAIVKAGLNAGEHVPGFPLGSEQARGLDIDNVVERNDIDAFGRDIDDLTTLAAYLGVD